MSIKQIKGSEGLKNILSEQGLWFPSSCAASWVAFQVFVEACDVVGGKFLFRPRQTKSTLNFTKPGFPSLSVSNGCHWLSGYLKKRTPASLGFAKGSSASEDGFPAAFAIRDYSAGRRGQAAFPGRGVHPSCGRRTQRVRSRERRGTCGLTFLFLLVKILWHPGHF